MSDLISKRSATERLIIAKTLLESVLQDMPSTEPSGELIRCGECKYYNEEEHLCNDLMGFGRYWEEGDYCSYAERRSDDD